MIFPIFRRRLALPQNGTFFRTNLAPHGCELDSFGGVRPRCRNNYPHGQMMNVLCNEGIIYITCNAMEQQELIDGIVSRVRMIVRIDLRQVHNSYSAWFFTRSVIRTSQHVHFEGGAAWNQACPPCQFLLPLILPRQPWRLLRKTSWCGCGSCAALRMLGL